MAIPSLPVEIVDLVIDHHREDKTTLQSCSLVCRAWVSRAKHHLLFRVIFNVRSRSRLLNALHLLQSPLCTIQPHIRGLKFCVNLSDIPLMVTLAREANACSTLLILRMGTSPGFGLTLMDDFLLEFLPTLENLRHLKLKYVCFESPEHYIRLLASLPAIESLVVYGVDSHDDVDPYSEDGQNSLVYVVPPPANLRHIFIEAIGACHELRWLTVHCGHPLTTLHLHNLTPESLPVVLDYVRRSSHLQCLSFDFCRWETHKDLQLGLMAQMDLSSHHSLRHLRLNSSHIVPLLFKFLPRIRSHLEEITISTSGYYAGHAPADLHKIFMDSPAVRNLKHLYVDERDIGEVSGALPEFSSRGIILPLPGGDFGRETGRLSLSLIHH